MIRVIFTCLLSLLVALPALALELPLLSKAEVGNKQVMLRDLLSPADAKRLEQLSGPIRLFRAPQPGMTRKVSRQTLARLVNRQVKVEQLRLSGAASVSITRKGIWIKPDEVEAVLGEYLDRVEKQLSGVELSLENLQLPARFLVAAGKIEHQVIPANPKVIGSRRMTLITRVDGHVVSNRSIRVLLKARAQVVVAAADLKRGESLSKAELDFQQREISKLEEPFFSIEPLLGKRVKQLVRMGQPLQRRQVEFPPLIKRGQQVTIQARNRGLLLKASGEARQNGERGETIKVRNIRSQREVLCRVEASGLVSVEF